MKHASSVLVALSFLTFAPLALAGRAAVGIGEAYNEMTPDPNGEMTCTVNVGGTKVTDRSAVLTISLNVDVGEAEMPELRIGDGHQPGCDIFRNGPHETRIALDAPTENYFFTWVLNLHAHPGMNCNVGGPAGGTVHAGVTIRVDKGELVSNLSSVGLTITCP